jgi:hypothetical protein
MSEVSVLDFLTKEEVAQLKANIGEERFNEVFGSCDTFDKDYGCTEGEILSGDF